MKLSKLMHLTGVVVGLAGVVAFLAAVTGGVDDLVWGVTKIDALLCAGILVLVAIWLQLAAIYHMMLEKREEVVSSRSS